MPFEADQAKLEQPWKKWHSLLNAKESIKDGGMVLNDGEGNTPAPVTPSTQHGTVALSPRHDVDFSKAKAGH